MDRASSLIFPGGRTLAAWWRQLAPYQPRAIWISYIFVHRLEAAVSVDVRQPLETLDRLVLSAMDLEHQTLPDVPVANLVARLQLPIAMMQRILHGVESHGLARLTSPGTWGLTEAGRQALANGTFSSVVCERRIFPFVERLDPHGRRVAEPHFFPLSECASVPWLVDEEHRIDASLLQAAFDAPAEWKRTCGFPLDARPLADEANFEDWQRVLVDRGERYFLVLILEGKLQELLGFAVKTDSWTLHDRTPVLRLPASARRLWPELDADTPNALWHEAWRSWCRQRQLPANETEICALTYAPPRLEIQPPPRLLQRLQAAKSDLFKGEAWILAGEGYHQSAAQLSIRAPSPHA